MKLFGDKIMKLTGKYRFVETRAFLKPVFCVEVEVEGETFDPIYMFATKHTYYIPATKEHMKQLNLI